MLKFFVADLGSGIFSTHDPGFGMEKFGSGIDIPDPQHCPLSIVFFIFSLECSTLLTINVPVPVVYIWGYRYVMLIYVPLPPPPPPHPPPEVRKEHYVPVSPFPHHPTHRALLFRTI
jgi:hypothetical protein